MSFLREVMENLHKMELKMLNCKQSFYIDFDNFLLNKENRAESMTNDCSFISPYKIISCSFYLPVKQ